MGAPPVRRAGPGRPGGTHRRWVAAEPAAERRARRPGSDPGATGTPALEAGLWFFFYFTTERGRRGLSVNRRELARLVWTELSPSWNFGDATFDRTAPAFDNEDFVDVVIHFFRHRLGLAPSCAPYTELEEQLAALPPITAPAITLDGQGGGPNFPASDGTASAHHFTGPRTHRQVPGAGHNLPQEAPQAFADAVLDLADPARAR